MAVTSLTSRVHFFEPADTKSYQQHRGYIFFNPQTQRQPSTFAGAFFWTHRHKERPTLLRVYFFEPANSKNTRHLRGYTPRTKRERATSTPSRVYFYVPANKGGYNNSHTQSRGYTFIYPRTKRERATSTPSRVYFYVPADTGGTISMTLYYIFAGILFWTREQSEVSYFNTPYLYS